MTANNSLWWSTAGGSDCQQQSVIMKQLRHTHILVCNAAQPLSIKCHLSSTSSTMSCNNLPNDSGLMVRLSVEITAQGWNCNFLPWNYNCKILPLKFHLTVTHTWPHYLSKIRLQHYSQVIMEVAWFWNMIIKLMARDNLTLVGEKFYSWLCISEIFKKVTDMMPMVICPNETNCHWHNAGYLTLLSFTGIESLSYQ